MSFNEIKLFKALSATDYSSLVHLELRDDVWDGTRWSWGPPDTANFNELGRVYLGIHEFISALPCLRHLWVNERCLVVPMDISDAWDYHLYDTSNQENKRRTIESPQWGMLAQTFQKLESLRVGFGPMDSRWVAEVLKLCNPKLLGQFGFDWDWRAFGKEQVRGFLLMIFLCVE